MRRGRVSTDEHTFRSDNRRGQPNYPNNCSMRRDAAKLRDSICLTNSAFRSQPRTSLVVGLENKPWAWTAGCGLGEEQFSKQNKHTGEKHNGDRII